MSSQIQDIFEQVDEELEAERVEKFWRANRGWIVSGILLFFIALFSYVGWREYRENQDIQAADKFLQAMEAMDKGQNEEGLKQISTLQSQFGGHGYATLAPLLEAKALTDTGKPEAALAVLEQLGKNDQALAPLRALAWLQAAYLVAGQPEKAEGYLANIPVESAFIAPALELKGLFALGRGDRAGALALFREAQGKRPQNTLRERLDLLVQRLTAGQSEPAKP